MTSRLVSPFHSDPLFIPSLYAFSHKIKDLGHISDSSSILPASATIQLCLWWVGGSHQVSFSCRMDVLASDALKLSDMAKMPFSLGDSGLGHDCASWLWSQMSLWVLPRARTPPGPWTVQESRLASAQDKGSAHSQMSWSETPPQRPPERTTKGQRCQS